MRKGRGLSTKGLLVPSIIVIAALYAVILVFTFLVDSIDRKMAEATEKYISYSDISQMMQKGSDTLTADVRLYVSTGETEYLDGYFKEANEDKNREKAVELLRSHDIDDTELMFYLEQALEQSRHLMLLEYRAMKLRAEADGSDVSAYPEVASYTLSAEDEALSKSEKLLLSLKLVTGEAYHQEKVEITSNVGNALGNLLSATRNEHAALSGRATLYTSLQIVFSIVLVIALIFVFYLVFRTLVLPVMRYADQVSDDEQMESKNALSELRRLSQSYNNLRDKQKNLEEELRHTAETDALTGLPNRLAQNYFFESLNNWEDCPIAVISFDVNGLKIMNDTSGHAKGDEMLRNVADCIIATFGNGTGKNCFRIGGDEFSSCLLNVTEGKVEELIADFRLAQKHYGISVAVGYAYAESLRAADVSALFEEADGKMYADKAAIKAAR